MSGFLGMVDFLLDCRTKPTLINVDFINRLPFFDNVFLFSLSVLLSSVRLTLVPRSVPGELYFLATGAPSATARAGFIYKIVDPSRYLTVKELCNFFPAVYCQHLKLICHHNTLF